MGWVAALDIPSPGNPNATSLNKCTVRSLSYQVPAAYGIYPPNTFAGYTGLAQGFRTNNVIVTTGSGYIIPLDLVADPGPNVMKAVQAGPIVQWACRYNATGAPIFNTGGTGGCLPITLQRLACTARVAGVTNATCMMGCAHHTATPGAVQHSAVLCARSVIPVLA